MKNVTAKARSRVTSPKATTKAPMRAPRVTAQATARLISLRPNGQLTIPAEIRARVHAKAGDIFEAHVAGDAIVLRPKKLVDADQAYFWTPEWQKAEREASEDIKKGRYKTFDSVDELIADLHR